jgi:DNA-binding transcriptional regulator YhcF (GntR family)
MVAPLAIDRAREPAMRQRPPANGARRAVSWSQIERAILLRIAHGEYLPGERIPSCEALAAEFGANKNTVNRAYQSLVRQGYLLTRPGFGTYISRRPVKIDVDGESKDIRGLLALAVQEAKLGGLDRAAFGRLVDEVARQGYANAGPRVGFIECNRHDATTLSRDLQTALSHPIEPLLMDEVIAEPGRFVRDYDILAVNLSHLQAIEAAMRGQRGAAEVVGMHIPIDPESLTTVVRFRAGTRVGIVCDLQQTLVSLTAMVQAYNPRLQVDGGLTRDRARLRTLLASSDVLLVTPSAAERLRGRASQVPVVSLAFRPDTRSVEQLSSMIAGAGAKNARPSSMPSRRAAARDR